MPLTDYERLQLEAIASWKGEELGWASRTMDWVRRPLGRLGEHLIPESTLRKALDSLEAALDTDRQVPEFLKEAGVTRVEDLQRAPLQECDRLALRGGVRAERMALGLGAAAGVGGLPTELAGIPLFLTAALRSIHRTALCYGYCIAAQAGRHYLLGVLELACVNEPARRQSIRRRLARMDQGQVGNAEPPIGLDAVEEGVASDLALEAVPIVGDPVAIILDYTMMKRVDRTARMVFQERWLKDNGRIEGEIAAVPAHPRDEAVRNLREIAGQTMYLASFGIGFGVVLPIAAVGLAAGVLPSAARRGARDGARDAMRSVEEFRAGWSETGETLGALGSAPVSTG